VRDGLVFSTEVCVVAVEESLVVFGRAFCASVQTDTPAQKIIEINGLIRNLVKDASVGLSNRDNAILLLPPLGAGAKADSLPCRTHAGNILWQKYGPINCLERVASTG